MIAITKKRQQYLKPIYTAIEFRSQKRTGQMKSSLVYFNLINLLSNIPKMREMFIYTVISTLLYPSTPFGYGSANVDVCTSPVLSVALTTIS